MRLLLFLLAPLGLAGLAVVACGAPSIEGDELPDLTVPGRVKSEPGTDAGPDDEPKLTEQPVDAGPGDASGDADAADANRTLHAFPSSALYNGNLGGLAGADAKCQALATAKGYTGTFRAWISISGTNAADRITSSGPWELSNGVVVAKTKAQLSSGLLEVSPNKDEKGATLPTAEDRVWTATGANGTFNGPDCNGWTTTGGNGFVGEAEHKNGQWTALVAEACSEVNRIYCFEL